MQRNIYKSRQMVSDVSRDYTPNTIYVAIYPDMIQKRGRNKSQVITTNYKLLQQITSYYNKLEVITTNHKLLQQITSYYNKLQVITTNYKLLQQITSYYNKLQVITTNYKL